MGNTRDYKDYIIRTLTKDKNTFNMMGYDYGRPGGPSKVTFNKSCAYEDYLKNIIKAVESVEIVEYEEE